MPASFGRITRTTFSRTTLTGYSVKGSFWITVLTDSDDAILNTFDINEKLSPKKGLLFFGTLCVVTSDESF